MQGFLTEEEPTGYFGAHTEAALRKWQVRRGVRSGTRCCLGRQLAARTRVLTCCHPAAAPTLCAGCGGRDPGGWCVWRGFARSLRQGAAPRA